MKISSILLIGTSVLFFSCSNPESSNEEEAWTKNQEIHFYNDCSDKMISSGMDDEEAHEFCVCCLTQVKTQFETGREAMEKLTDEDIERIEKACFEN